MGWTEVGIIVPFGRLGCEFHSHLSIDGRGAWPSSHIDARMGTAVTLAQIPSFLPDVQSLERHANPAMWAEEVCESLRHTCELRRSHEHLFLMLYFEHIACSRKSRMSEALAPLPNAHLRADSPHHCAPADFAFWTGSRFIAAMIHEDKQMQASAENSRRMLSRGVDVLDLSAIEIETQGLSRLLRFMKTEG